MTMDRLPDRVREFTDLLYGLVARLDPDGGWYAVFRQRDPDGMRACLDGRDVPPWDVVAALLQDFEAAYGADAAVHETGKVRSLHEAALAAHDARPGGRDILTDRLDTMLREQRLAAGRLAKLHRSLLDASTAGQADSIRWALAWAQDDHARATARCAELRSRLAGPDRRGADDVPPHGPASAERRRGGARFAGAATVSAEPVPVPIPVPVSTAPGRRTPRGARFAGAVETARPPATGTGTGTGPDDDQAVAAAVRTLALLRGEERGGEAHALLAEAARWPAARYPLLAERLGRSDWATLLWEAASLPVERLVAAADALAAAGHGPDAERLLRQGVVRPAAEVGETARGLALEGRTRELRALLDAYVRVSAPEEVARSAAPDPARLAPLLLEAARGVSDARHRDLVHALRVAGFAA